MAEQSSTLTLTAEERNAVVDLIIRELVDVRALDLFRESKTRRMLADYAEIADELGFDEPTARETYPVERSVAALRRVLTEWRDVSNRWLESHADTQEQRRVPDEERARDRAEFRLELWARCQSILDRLDENR